MRIVSRSPQRTRQLGRAIAKKILKTKKDRVVLGLKGALGSGKTTFIDGFARGLGLKKRMMSPTFIIVRHHRLRGGSKKHFFHMDAYRIGKISELRSLDFKKMISTPRSITVIEWPEKVRQALPKDTSWLEFRHGRKEN